MGQIWTQRLRGRDLWSTVSCSSQSLGLCLPFSCVQEAPSLTNSPSYHSMLYDVQNCLGCMSPLSMELKNQFCEKLAEALFCEEWCRDECTFRQMSLSACFSYLILWNCLPVQRGKYLVVSAAFWLTDQLWSPPHPYHLSWEPSEATSWKRTLTEANNRFTAGISTSRLFGASTTVRNRVTWRVYLWCWKIWNTRWILSNGFSGERMR